MASLGRRHPGQVPGEAGVWAPEDHSVSLGGRSTASGWRAQVLTRYKVFGGQSPGLGATTLNKASGNHDKVCPSPLTL